MPDDCPDPIQNLKDAIDSIENAYVDSQIDALKDIGSDLDNSVSNLPTGATSDEQLKVLCAELRTSFDKFNNLRNSCTFDPTGCLKQVLDSGVLDGNPAAAGAAIAAATFVDAISGQFTPPFTVPPPSLGIGVETPNIPANVDLPDIPAPPPSDECPDPINDVNAALKSAEDTYLDLHKNAVKGLADSVSKFAGDLGGLPTQIKANAFCVGVNAGFDAAAALNASCQIDVGECLKQVLESGILGSNPAIGGAALGAALFADSTAGAFPSIN